MKCIEVVVTRIIRNRVEVADVVWLGVNDIGADAQRSDCDQRVFGRDTSEHQSVDQIRTAEVINFNAQRSSRSGSDVERGTSLGACVGCAGSKSDQQFTGDKVHTFLAGAARDKTRLILGPRAGQVIYKNTDQR